MMKANVHLTQISLLCSAILLSAGAQAQQSCVVDPPLELDPLQTPFATDSIWNRTIPADAIYVDVQDAIFGDTAEAPTRVNLDLITVAYVDPTQPLVRIENNVGYGYPDRASSSGKLLYERHLADNAAIGISWSKSGNALFTIIDLATGYADEGVGSWRCPGESLLTFNPDSPFGHYIDVINGHGRLGYGRASRLPSLGGAIRMGEINTGIFHAVAVNLSSLRYSSTNHFVWPASGADDFATSPLNGYFGSNPNYTIGTLLAIPPDIDLNSFSWATPQGRTLAQSAQDYGWYITDSATGGLPGGDLVAMAMEVKAAKVDFGLAIDPVTNLKTVDPLRLDVAGFNRDTLKVLTLVKAVVSNIPALSITPIPSATVVTNGSSFNYMPAVTAEGSVTWSLLSPAFPPPGMAFNTATGELAWIVDSLVLPLAITILATSPNGSDSVTSTLIMPPGIVPTPTPTPAPASAHDPMPANLDAGVNVDSDLSWAAGSGSVSSNVYFGNTNPPAFVQNQTGASYDLDTLAYNSTFYWRIDEINETGITTGMVWRFTTEAVPTGSETLLFDNFEDGNFATEGWITDWVYTREAAVSGTRAAKGTNSSNDLVSRNVDTSGRSTLTVSFYYYDDDIDNSDNVMFQVWNGSRYVNVVELGVTSPEDTWQFYTITVSNIAGTSQFFRPDFKIKFEGSSIDSFENLGVDDVKIVVE